MAGSQVGRSCAGREHAGSTGWRPDGRTKRPVVLVTTRNDIRPQPGFVVSAEQLDEIELVYLDGLRTTTSLRSLLFEVRFAPSLLAAVVAIDMAAYSDLVSIHELVEFIRTHVGWPGYARPEWRATLPMRTAGRRGRCGFASCGCARPAFPAR